MDPERGLPSYPDNFFDLAIVDPPYGIKQDGRNNHTRGKLAKPKDYRGKSMYDDCSPSVEYFNQLKRVSRNQIIWGQIILLVKSHLTVAVGLFGIKTIQEILQIVN